MRKNLRRILCLTMTFILLSLSAVTVFATTGEQTFEVKYLQTSNVVNNKYLIRFVGVSTISAVACGMDIKVWESKSGTTLESFNSADYTSEPAIKHFYTESCELYDELSGYEAGGIEGYKAADYGVDYFFAVAIQNVAAGRAYTFEITPFYMSDSGKQAGEPVYALFDENGNCLNTMLSGFGDAAEWKLSGFGDMFEWQGNSFGHVMEWRVDTPFTVMSMNTGGNDTSTASISNRMTTLANCVGSVQPDSIGIQEYTTRVSSGVIGGLENKLKGYTNVSFSGEYASAMTWLATFYNTNKYEVEDSACKTLSVNGDNHYGITWVVFKYKNTKKLAYIHANVHFDYESEEVRAKNAQGVNTELTKLLSNEAYASLPLVMTGDYNVTRDEEASVIATISGDNDIRDAVSVAVGGMSDAGYTYHGWGQFDTQANDKVLINNAKTKVYKHQVIRDYESNNLTIAQASDHYPVVVKFLQK